MDQRKKHWTILAGASAALLLCVGASNAFLHPVAPPSSTSPTVAQASILDDADDDDSCSDPAQTAQLMSMLKPAGQKAAIVAPSDASTAASSGAPVGGDIAPARTVADSYPSFHSVAVDPQSNQVIISDSNRGAIFSYDRAAGGNSPQSVPQKWEIRGPATGMMFVAGIALDPVEHEVFAVNNDIGDRMEVFAYGQEGNVKPKRVLAVPHGAWGVSVNRARDEVAVSIEHPNTVVVFRREAKAAEPPLRVLHGLQTGLADPHGIVVDSMNDEMIVANHGNWAPLTREEAEVDGKLEGGRFMLPSIITFSAEASGNTKPKRAIQGQHTQLNWPMGMALDAQHNEIAVANYGNNSVLIFRRTDDGNVAPVREIRGDRTGILGPMGVAIDTTNDELWVTNYREHTAVVFARTASGNVAPKRTLRNAPQGTPSVGFGNPGAVAFDSKRDEILVPN
jgi:DNA-binding beta-propeller fold protein YncE